MDIGRFKKLPVMGILRNIEVDMIEPLVETVVSAGLETIEIAMNSKEAEILIKKAVNAAGKRLMIGAGTVLNLETLKLSIDSGATFIVTPVMVEDVAEYCVSNVIPFFPGAITPTEIYTAWRAGATMVKVFPSRFFGPSYIKEIKGPFDKIELMACGGVNSSNIRDYFDSGASAVAFGSGILKKEWLCKKGLASIKKAIRSIVQGASES